MVKRGTAGLIKRGFFSFVIVYETIHNQDFIITITWFSLIINNEVIFIPRGKLVKRSQ